MVFEAPSKEAAATDADDLTQAESERSLEPVVTVVKLHVPENATVNLAGNETKGSGAVRTFRTTQLKPGQRWENYTVRVTAEINGQKMSRERTINVQAGSNNELSFEFDPTAVAKH